MLRFMFFFLFVGGGGGGVGVEHSISCNVWFKIFFSIIFFVAAGRAPNSKRLNLEAVGVEVDGAGAIKVDIALL